MRESGRFSRSGSGGESLMDGQDSHRGTKSAACGSGGATTGVSTCCHARNWFGRSSPSRINALGGALDPDIHPVLEQQARPLI
jgi:hypothetical protein